MQGIGQSNVFGGKWPWGGDWTTSPIFEVRAGGNAAVCLRDWGGEAGIVVRPRPVGVARRLAPGSVDVIKRTLGKTDLIDSAAAASVPRASWKGAHETDPRRLTSAFVVG